MNAEENKKTEFRGKEYTKYEALQRQRKLETTMREQRRRIRLLEEGGADEDDILAAKARYRATSHEYAELSKATGLPQQRQRVYVDGLGTIKAKSVDNSGGSGIINYAKPIEWFNYSDIPSSEVITSENIIDELSRSDVGKDTLSVIESLPNQIKFTYGEYISKIRGKEEKGQITIYLNNCKDVLWAARSVIHECTHYQYGIGESQWAECVCIVQELKHARGRDKLNYTELKNIVKAVKEAYPEYN